MIALLLSAALAAIPGQDGYTPPEVQPDRWRQVPSGWAQAVEDARPSPEWTARADLRWGHRVLTFIRGDGHRTAILGDALWVDLAASRSLGPVRLALAAPVRVAASSEVGAGGAALGDAEVAARVVLLEGTAGLAALGWVRVPLGGAGHLAGSSGPTAWIGGAVDGELGRWRLAGTGGLQLAQGVDVGDLHMGSSVTVAGAAGWVVRPGWVVSLETRAAVDLTSPSLDGLPAELLLGTHHTHGSRELRGAVGAALTPGIGAPALRVVVGAGRAVNSP